MDSQEIEDKIKRRRNQILVHSYLYYRMDISIISDETFDGWSKELADLQTNYPQESKCVDNYETFKDFTGSTGAFLPLDQDFIERRARWLLYCKKIINGEVKLISEHTKVLQQTRKTGCESNQLKKADKQRCKSLF